MRRRRLLGLAVGTVGAGLAGCLAPAASPPRADPDRVRSVAGVELPVPADALQGGTTAAAIDPVVDPAFAADWSGVAGEGDDRGPRLTGADPVIGVVRGGERGDRTGERGDHTGERGDRTGGDGARAYPLRVLGVHEVVNDHLGGPLLVTYCPACASGVVALRRVDGRERTFAASGLLWRNNLLLVDRETGSLWSQLAMTAVRGPATGETLRPVPATLTTWDAWRETHPDTVVLLPPPASGTAYGSTALGGYGPRDDRVTAVDPDGSATTDVDEFTRVIGVAHGGVARAYPRPVVRAAGGVVTDRVGGRPVVVALGPGGRLAAYDRRVDGATLPCSPGEDRATFRGGGSRWLTLTGVAIDGPHEGSRLRRATDVPGLFLRAWRDFHPETTVYGAGA